MPAKPRQRHRVGAARDADDQRVIVFESPVALLCDRCGSAIHAGALFSWHSQQGPSSASSYHLGLVTVWTTGRPLQVVEGDGHG